MRKNLFTTNELLILKSAISKFINKESLEDSENLLIKKALHGDSSINRVHKVLEYIEEELEDIQKE
jgi:hypothetical protein